MARTSIFKSPVLLLGLAILVLVSFLWVLGGSWQLENAQRWNMVLAVGGALYFALFIYAVREHLADRRLKKAMSDQAQKQNKGAGPEAQRDFEVLERDFNQAFDELSDLCRDQGLFRGEGATKLPWVVVVGPGGAGKTTALEHSGLRFTPLGRRLQGIGGTRNCTWWLAQEAVVLDTAGRFATKEESREEWLAFLNLLRKRRRRQPIDSAIVQIGVDELLPLGRREQEAMALQLRERLDELTRHLGVSFPVHLVFGKADFIDGFAEFCAQLPASERARPFGFPLSPEGLGSADMEAAFASRFDGLCDGLLGRTTRYMYGAGSRDAQEAVLYFPLELRRHKDVLSHFVRILFEADRRGEGPQLSGVYLTSALQQGAALPGMRQGLGGELGLRVPPAGRRPPPPLRTEPTPYFLTGLFSRVLRQAQKAARPNRARQATMRLHLWLSTGAAALFCFGGGWALSHGYRSDERWLKDVKESVQALRAGKGLRSTTQATLSGLGEELQQQVSLDELLHQRPADGELGEAYGAAMQALRSRIDQELLRPLRDVMDKHLYTAATWEKNGPGDVFGNGYRALQADLVLHRGQCAGTGPDEPLNVIVDYADSLWWQELGEKTRKPDAEQVRQNLRQMLTLFFRRYLKTPGEKTELLIEDGSRQKNAQDRLRDGSSILTPGLVFNLVVSGGGLYVTDRQLNGDVFTDEGIPAAFTQAGCKTFFNKDSSTGKQWWSCVLGVKADRKLDPGQAEVAGYFVEQYQLAWQDWIARLGLRNNIQTRRAGEALAQVSQTLQVLSRSEDSELEQLLKIIGHGKDQDRRRKVLIEKSGEDDTWWGGCMKKIKGAGRTVAKKAEALAAPECETAAQPYGPFTRALETEKKGEPQDSYQNYLKSLRALDKTLQHLRRSTDGAADALLLVLGTMKDNGELREVAAARREFSYNLQLPKTVDPQGLLQALERLESVTWSSLVSLSVEALNDQWNSVVYLKWKDLHSQAQKDPAFCPKVLDFVKQELGSHVDKNILPFFKEGTCDPKVPAEPFNQVLMNFTPDFCDQLNKVRALATAKCPEGGGAPPPPPEPEPPRVPTMVDYKPSTLPFCQNKTVQTVTLDTGDTVFECKTQFDRNCAPLAAIRSAQQASLRVEMLDKYKVRLPTSPDHPTLDDLIDKYGKREGDNRVRFLLPKDQVGGECSGIEVVLDFKAKPKKPAPPKGPPEDNRWRTLDLPQKVALPPKIPEKPAERPRPTP